VISRSGALKSALLVLAGVVLQGAMPAGATALLHDEVAVERFYAGRNGAPAWTGTANTAAWRQLLDAIRIAGPHGLDPADYHLAELVTADPAAADAWLDRIATDAYLTLAAHLLAGRLDPVSIEPNWTAVRRGRDLAAYLEAALASGAISESLEALAPAQSGYANLKVALAQYRDIAERGGWPSIDDGPRLRLGDRGQRVAQLRKRLAATRDVAGETDNPELFDEALAEAVGRFQKRANLEPDGVVGRRTLAQLNRTVEDRIAQIRANLERWRWLPDDLGRRHIRVNVADFRLEAYADGAPVRTHGIIVGRLYRKTPVFTGMMSYLVFNPWWETPASLAAKDKLPAFRADPRSVAALGFQVIDRNGQLVDPTTINWNAVTTANFPYRLRQAPGPENALGDVKFMLPNGHNVYLHDTPTRGLFARTRRDFSSGCVRVEGALDLAAWVLSDMPGWTPERVRELAATDIETHVNLDQPMPVHILYWTVVPDGAGKVRFIDDIYGRDGKLIAALDQ